MHGAKKAAAHPQSGGKKEKRFRSGGAGRRTALGQKEGERDVRIDPGKNGIVSIRGERETDRGEGRSVGNQNAFANGTESGVMRRRRIRRRIRDIHAGWKRARADGTVCRHIVEGEVEEIRKDEQDGGGNEESAGPNLPESFQKNGRSGIHHPKRSS